MSNLHPKTVIDLGCGEGIVAETILGSLGQINYIGYDKNPIAIGEAQRRNQATVFHRADIFDVTPTPDVTDMILCLEVMEHMEEPDRLLKHMALLRARHVIVSVPWEPFFRIGNLGRGRHLSRLGNHPEHVQCFGAKSLRSILSRHFAEVRIESSFPWLIGICRPSPLKL